MIMLELFSGSGRMAQAFKAKGWKVITIDNISKFNPSFCYNIGALSRDDIIEMCEGIPDFIHASPPCTAFSVASIGANWTGGHRAYIPKTDKARIGIALVKKTLEIISWFPECKWTIENPRGVLRKLGILDNSKLHTISFCRYGERRMKPTDIWTNLTTWVPRPMCKNGNPDHERGGGQRRGRRDLKGLMNVGCCR